MRNVDKTGNKYKKNFLEKQSPILGSTTVNVYNVLKWGRVNQTK